MSCRLHSVALVAFTALLVLLTAGPLQAQSEAARSEARTHLAEARRLFEAGDHAGSLRKLEAAYALVPSPKIMFSFGQTYRGLGRDPEALEAFERFVAEAKDVDPALHAEARQYIEELGRRVARIDVSSPTTGADVLIDGHTRGVTPLAKAIVVAPGAHDVEVRPEGSSSGFSERIEARAGEIVRVRTRLAASRPPSVRTAGAPPRTPPALDITSSPAKEKDAPRIYQRPWFWPAAAGAAVVLGIAVVVAASSSGTDVPHTSLGAQRAFR